MKRALVLSILLFAAPAVIFAGETDTKKDEVREFVAKVVSIEIGRAAGAIVVNADPRFLVTLDVLKSEKDAEKIETRVYAIHSPTHLFVGAEEKIGKTFSFKETTDAKTGGRHLEIVWTKVGK